MKHLLIAKEAWQHVVETAPDPGDNVAAQANHAKARLKAMATLVMGINLISNIWSRHGQHWPSSGLKLCHDELSDTL